jgi:hypothetical protein
MNFSGREWPPGTGFELWFAELLNWQVGHHCFLWEVHWPKCECSHCNRARESWWMVAVWFPSWKYMFRGGWKTGVLKLNGLVHYWRLT